MKRHDRNFYVLEMNTGNDKQFFIRKLKYLVHYIRYKYWHEYSIKGGKHNVYYLLYRCSNIIDDITDITHIAIHCNAAQIIIVKI